MVETLLRMENALAQTRTRRVSGRVASVTGLIIRAHLPAARIGELCELREPGEGRIGLAEVVGIEGELAFLSPHGETRGISIRTEVVPLKREATVSVGDFLVGAVVDAHGNVLRSGVTQAVKARSFMRPLYSVPEDPLQRLPITRVLPVGIPAVDGLLTCGEGQRVGIFGPPSAGKSTLIAEIVKRAAADVIVCALVGERGREVREFVERVMPAGQPSNVILVVATSNRPALERCKAVLMATTIAEHFRDEGRRVLLVVDSVTRVARALREVGLAAGEPPVRRGFPPSVFAALPGMFERAGNGSSGTMTAFYTVLVEGEGESDPIAEEAKALLDGHIILSGKLAQSGRFPAIDVLASRSRLMNALVTEEHRSAAERVRGMLSLYQEVELLIRVGEYREGQDRVSDEAVRKHAAIERFLYRSTERAFEKTVTALKELSR